MSHEVDRGREAGNCFPLRVRRALRARYRRFPLRRICLDERLDGFGGDGCRENPGSGVGVLVERWWDRRGLEFFLFCLKKNENVIRHSPLGRLLNDNIICRNNKG